VAFVEGNAVLSFTPQTTFVQGRLSGIKHGVTAGLSADFAVVWAKADNGEAVLVIAELETVPRRAIDSFDNSRLFAELSTALLGWRLSPHTSRLAARKRCCS
jgi:acyl-CoA dehydrogenase